MVPWLRMMERLRSLCPENEQPAAIELNRDPVPDERRLLWLRQNLADRSGSDESIRLSCG